GGASAAPVGAASAGRRGSAPCDDWTRAYTSETTSPTTASATTPAAKVIVRPSERQSSIVSPQTQCVPLEISQMAKAAMAVRRISGRVNSYQRGDCSAWSAPLAAA